MKISSRWEQAMSIFLMAALFSWSGFMASRSSRSVVFTILLYSFLFVLYVLWKNKEGIQLTPAWLIGMTLLLIASVSLWMSSAGGLVPLFTTGSAILAVLLLPVAFLKNRRNSQDSGLPSHA